MFTFAIATLFFCGVLLLAWYDFKQLRREWPVMRATLRYLRQQRKFRRTGRAA